MATELSVNNNGHGNLNGTNGAQRGYYELDAEARKRVADNIAQRSHDWCMEQGWTPEEVEVWANAARNSFSVPRRVNR